MARHSECDIGAGEGGPHGAGEPRPRPQGVEGGSAGEEGAVQGHV